VLFSSHTTSHIEIHRKLHTIASFVRIQRYSENGRYSYPSIAFLCAEVGESKRLLFAFKISSLQHLRFPISLSINSRVRFCKNIIPSTFMAARRLKLLSFLHPPVRTILEWTPFCVALHSYDLTGKYHQNLHFPSRYLGPALQAGHQYLKVF